MAPASAASAFPPSGIPTTTLSKRPPVLSRTAPVVSALHDSRTPAAAVSPVEARLRASLASAAEAPGESEASSRVARAVHIRSTPAATLSRPRISGRPATAASTSASAAGAAFVRPPWGPLLPATESPEALVADQGTVFLFRPASSRASVSKLAPVPPGRPGSGTTESRREALARDTEFPALGRNNNRQHEPLGPAAEPTAPSKTSSKHTDAHPGASGNARGVGTCVGAAENPWSRTQHPFTNSRTSATAAAATRHATSSSRAVTVHSITNTAAATVTAAAARPREGATVHGISGKGASPLHSGASRPVAGSGIAAQAPLGTGSKTTAAKGAPTARSGDNAGGGEWLVIARRGASHPAAPDDKGMPAKGAAATAVRREKDQGREEATEQRSGQQRTAQRHRARGSGTKKHPKPSKRLASMQVASWPGHDRTRQLQP